jgi:fumarylacetoacetase
MMRGFLLLILLTMEGSSSAVSWVEYEPTCHFPIQNIPFGAFKNPKTGTVNCCTRIGDLVIDLAWLESDGLLTASKGTFAQPTLNEFMALGKEAWHETRV